MRGDHWNRDRRIALGLIVLTIAGVFWYWFGPGLPVMRSPSAAREDIAQGRALFEHEWTVGDVLADGDGLGPVFNDRSCVACHNQGGIGGGGDAKHNVQSFEVIPTRLDKNFHNGQVHAFSVAPELQETPERLRQIFPVVKGGILSSKKPRDLDPVKVIPMNSTALFGSGWIDRISSQTIRSRVARGYVRDSVKEVGGNFENVPPGRPRILPDGRVGKFGWKAQFATLDEFVAAACGSELGLSTPVAPQATPLGHAPAAPGKPDLSKARFASLVDFVDTLPKPVETTPDDPAQAALAKRGKELFASLGCASCHAPDLGGVEGIYSDLLLHSIEDPEQIAVEYYEIAELEVQLPTSHPRPEEWRTAPLWGVADSAPYFHDGKSATLHEAIMRHRGHAKGVTKKYQNLGPDQDAVIAFLKTLKAPPTAAPTERVRVAAR